MSDENPTSTPASDSTPTADSAPAPESTSTQDSTPDSNRNLEILGRKIFMLYPTASVINQVIPELIQQEYEVYVAKDHGRLQRALKKYSDSIVYINIDEKMPEQEWEKWILNLNSTLPDVQFGIFSSNSSDELKEKYVRVLKVACGFLPLKVDMSKSGEAVIEILKFINVKGRRKYLRASTERESNASVNIPLGGDFVKGTVKDISVVGFSCVLENNPGLAKNTLQKDIQLRLQSMLLNVEAVVFGSRTEQEDKIYVFIFTQRIDSDVRIKIRKYVQQNLQSKMDTEIN